ncbi:MAG: LPS export ABC transporter periplasmic protein LptC [Gemmatimonadota bacterium]|nr:LPS export ABC transporter periplasmic protein LptC [Gemmatimonadota bacterium]
MFKAPFVFVSTFLALQACGKVEGPPILESGRDSATTVVFGLETVVTTNGLPRARVVADSAYQYDATQTFELWEVTVTFYNAQGGESSTLTSREGTYQVRTGDMEAREDVVAVTPDGRRLETSILKFLRAANQIESTAPFTYQAPGRNIAGSGFVSDPDFRDVRARNVSGGVNN